jgi:hypothetical protein
LFIFQIILRITQTFWFLINSFGCGVIASVFSDLSKMLRILEFVRSYFTASRQHTKKIIKKLMYIFAGTRDRTLGRNKAGTEVGTFTNKFLIILPNQTSKEENNMV